MGNALDSVSGNLADMLLIVEGAVSIFEKSPSPDSGTYSLIGEALYILRERVSECLTECQQSEKISVTKTDVSVDSFRAEISC